MLPMQSQEPLTGEKAQPEKDRHLWIRCVFRSAAGHIDKRLLQDVGGIEPSLQSPIQPQPHHATQTVAKTIKESSQGVPVPNSNPFYQVIEVVWFISHDRTH
jgi:hypothetical protein